MLDMIFTVVFVALLLLGAWLGGRVFHFGVFGAIMCAFAVAIIPFGLLGLIAHRMGETPKVEADEKTPPVE